MTAWASRNRARLTAPAIISPVVERRTHPRTRTFFNCLQAAQADLLASVWSAS